MSVPSATQRLARKVLASDAAKRGLRPFFYAWQDLKAPQLLARNARFRQRHAGERVFLLGTGASLRDIDTERLRGERLFGTGHLHSPELDIAVTSGRHGLAHQAHWPRRLRLDYYAAVDPVWEGSATESEVRFFIDYWRAAARVFTDPATCFFANGIDVDFFARHRFVDDDRLYFAKSAGPTLEARRLRHDLTRRMHFMEGSVFFMMAAALDMGFREIYLCGCDYTFQPRRSGHYYEDFELLDDQPVDAKHAAMARHAAAHGARILNVVPSGFTSPVYPAVSWDDVVRTLETRPAGRVTC